ncbi:MAG: c-type cytochrome domain-containing protein, partial [Pirellulales bacterium]
MNRHLYSSCLPALACVILFASAAGADEKQSHPAASAEFKTHTLSFLTTYCIDCHGADTQESDLRFDMIGHNMTDDKTARLWNDIFAQVQFSEMPPSDAEQPPVTAKATFLKQVEGELMRFGRGFGLDDKLLFPQYGNYVDHKSLFDGSIQEMPYTPSRLWRQRPIIYDAVWSNAYGRAPWYSVKIGGTGGHLIQRGPHKGKLMANRYFADAKYANPFFEFVHHASGFTDYASIVADQSSLEALIINAETMAEILTYGQKVRIVTQVKNKGSRTGNNEAMFVGGVSTSANEYRGRVPVIFRKIMNTEGAVERIDFNKALDVAFNLFLRRLPREDEYEHYWNKVFQKNAELGNTMALQSVLIYVTLSPEFVYRMELGLGEKDEQDRRFLSPQELTHAINYAFHNKPTFGVDEIETVDVYTKNSEAPIKKTMTTPSPTWTARHSSLVEEMRQGKLKTREDVERVVRKMLGGKGDG